MLPEVGYESGSSAVACVDVGDAYVDGRGILEVEALFRLY
jgi:hypothetical protein